MNTTTLAEIFNTVRNAWENEYEATNVQVSALDADGRAVGFVCFGLDGNSETVRWYGYNADGKGGLWENGSYLLARLGDDAEEVADRIAARLVRKVEHGQDVHVAAPVVAALAWNTL